MPLERERGSWFQWRLLLQMWDWSPARRFGVSRTSCRTRWSTVSRRVTGVNPAAWASSSSCCPPSHTSSCWPSSSGSTWRKTVVSWCTNSSWKCWRPIPEDWPASLGRSSTLLPSSTHSSSSSSASSQIVAALPPAHVVRLWTSFLSFLSIRVFDHCVSVTKECCYYHYCHFVVECLTVVSFTDCLVEVVGF